MHGWHIMFPIDYIIYNINEHDILSPIKSNIQVYLKLSSVTSAWFCLEESEEGMLAVCPICYPLQYYAQAVCWSGVQSSN